MRALLLLIWISVPLFAQAPDPNEATVVIGKPFDSDILFSERAWVDATGKFNVKARLLDIIDGNVRLLRKDTGEVIELQLAKLSLDDQQYCVSLHKKLLQELISVQLDGIEPNKLLARETNTLLAAIQLAIEDFTTKVVSNESDQKFTTALKAEANKEALSDLLKAFKPLVGRRIQLHFKVGDVIHNNKQLDIAVVPADFRLQINKKRFAVAYDTRVIKNLQQGDIIRVDAKICQMSRKTIEKFALYFDGPKEREPWRSFMFEESGFGYSYPYFTCNIYVEGIQKLSVDEAQKVIASSN